MQNHTFSLPNILTYSRIVSVVLVVVCFFWQNIHPTAFGARFATAVIFVIACFSDFLDGFLARIWCQTSRIGQMLDPIADKLLVSSSLLLLTADRTIYGISIVAALIILMREILVSGLREYLAELRVKVPVSSLAKWKTATQMVAMTLLLWGPAGERLFSGIIIFGLILLWISAILTLITGWAYLREGLDHI